MGVLLKKWRFIGRVSVFAEAAMTATYYSVLKKGMAIFPYPKIGLGILNPFLFNVLRNT